MATTIVFGKGSPEHGPEDVTDQEDGVREDELELILDVEVGLELV